MQAIAQPLTLPCGAIIPNRLIKAAITEGLADPFNLEFKALALKEPKLKL